MKNAVVIWGFLLIPFYSGCGEKESFSIVRFLQEGRADVRLNERLILRFSNEVDRSSVTADTVVLRDDRGMMARGTWSVRGREVYFLPALPVKPDCSDVGIAPGRNYTVRVSGFPGYCALRSTKGVHLAKSAIFSFHAISESKDRLASFVDPKPESGPLIVKVNGAPVAELKPEGIEVQPGSALELTFSEPLFPISVFESQGKLIRIDKEIGVDLELDALPYLARITAGEPRGAVIVLEPRGGFLAGRQYKLMPEFLDFTDFGGKGVERNMSFISIICPDTSH